MKDSCIKYSEVSEDSEDTRLNVPTPHLLSCYSSNR